MAFSPLNRITPIAPIPGGVASATMVSFHPDNFKLMRKITLHKQKSPYLCKGILKIYFKYYSDTTKVIGCVWYERTFLPFCSPGDHLGPLLTTSSAPFPKP